MKKSWVKIGFIVWDVLCIVLRIFKLETQFAGNQTKHRYLRNMILDVCIKRGWNFTSTQIDAVIHGIIKALKEILKKRRK